MKRLVICCDGTWNRPDADYVTNIEKIARTVQTDLQATGGVQQLVLYQSGVGVGYGVDRILGGAFGLGLFSSVLAGYRFLALNYEPGDEIFIFGFSRGAYTARSLGGMIGKVGLLTRDALVAEKLPEAVARYRQADPSGGKFGQSVREFKHDYCHPDTPINFIGVFDTVGALGVPGAWSRKHQFHDVKLSDAVKCARHALAIDEPRMKFEPCLWEVAECVEEDDRVKQVWFEGAHSDIGGGVDKTGLPDTALLWMVTEANKQGLAFDERLLSRYLGSGSSAIRHNPSKLMYRLLDLVIRLKILLHLTSGGSFIGRQRRLAREECVSVRIAEPSADHFRAGDYKPANIADYSTLSNDFTGVVEHAIGLPEPSYEGILQRLAERGISLGRTAPPAGARLPEQSAQSSAQSSAQASAQAAPVPPPVRSA